MSSIPADIHENLQFSQTPASIDITNTSGHEVHVTSVTPARSGDRVLNWPSTLGAGATASITVQVATETMPAPSCTNSS